MSKVTTVGAEREKAYKQGFSDGQDSLLYNGQVNLMPEAEAEKAVKEAVIDIIEYVMKEPCGTQTMTTKQMRETPDERWRDEVIQYFFNTESLRFNLQRRLEELRGKDTKEVVNL